MTSRHPAEALDQRSVAEAAAQLMPELKDELARLVAIPSVSAPGFPAETKPALIEAHEVAFEPRQGRP